MYFSLSNQAQNLAVLTNGEPDGLLHGEAAVAAAGVVHEEEDDGDEGGRAQDGHPQLQGEGHHELQQHSGSHFMAPLLTVCSSRVQGASCCSVLRVVYAKQAFIFLLDKTYILLRYIRHS